LSDNIWKPVSSSISSVSKPIVFNGVGFDLDESNSYLFPILKASQYTHCSDEKVKTSGSDITLVAGYQSRLNSRFIFSGSLDMCSDEYISFSTPLNKNYQSSPNFNFCMDLINWTF